jgi:hypothetical protein
MSAAIAPSKTIYPERGIVTKQGLMTEDSRKFYIPEIERELYPNGATVEVSCFHYVVQVEGRSGYIFPGVQPTILP